MKKILTYIFTSIVCVLMGVSCSQEQDVPLEYALAFAGENRCELETVLKHYADQSEKLEAAKFLIRNMPRYYGYSGWQLDSVESVLIQIEDGVSVPKKTMDKWSQFTFASLPKVYDAHVITADYLIENIDLAFDVRDRYEWNRDLPFDDFCELVLPYRVGDEPLSSWRKLYYDYYSPLLDMSVIGADVVKACNVVNDNLFDRWYTWFDDFNLPHQRADFLLFHRVGYCRDVAAFTIYAMRACGIPVAEDMIVYSPESQNSHSWNVLRDTTGRYLQFGIEEFSANRDTIQSDGRKKGKVFRACFGFQNERLGGAIEDEDLLPFFKKRFMKDATANYFGNNEIKVSSSFITDQSLIYLGVFTPDKWFAIAAAKSKKETVTFQNIEPLCIYQPFAMTGGIQQTISYPFIFINDSCLELCPDQQNNEDVVLHRKMPRRPKNERYLHRYIIGAKIEASIDLEFTNPDLLYEFKDSLDYNYFELDPYIKGKSYKYIRYVSPQEKPIELAELAVYNKEKQVGLKCLNALEPIAEISHITDENVVSYFLSRDSSCALTFEMEELSTISKIAYSPRNDDNFVWPGDEYELFYQNGTTGWVSLGRKTATDRTITFSAPKNALLWLRNLTKGREEQVFVYRNGRQYFAYDIDENFPLD